MDFVRPAAYESWFDDEGPPEWGQEPFEPWDPTVGPPCFSAVSPGLGGTPATRSEAYWFWAEGGWDDYS